MSLLRLSVLSIRSGKRLSSLTRAASFRRVRLFRRPSAMVRISNTASCAVNALVEATPTSCPAIVSIEKSDSRTSELVATLQIAR